MFGYVHCLVYIVRLLVVIYRLNFKCLKQDSNEVCYTKFTLQRWHKGAPEVAFRCLYTDCLLLFKDGINAFTQQLQVYTTLMQVAEVGQSINLVWLLRSILRLH